MRNGKLVFEDRDSRAVNTCGLFVEQFRFQFEKKLSCEETLEAPFSLKQKSWSLEVQTLNC